MLCQLCEDSQAIIKIAQVINQKKIEINLCKACAEQKGVENPMVTLPQIFGDFVTELIGDEETEHEFARDLTCRGCGLSWKTFEKTGLLGCDICYQTFCEDLDLVLRRVHGSAHHIGNRPRSSRKCIDEQELHRIKLNLREAIKNENFELASELRDLVRDAGRDDTQGEDDGILR